MAAKKVKVNVHVTNEKTGESFWLRPGDSVPAGVTIDNPHVFEEPDTDIQAVEPDGDAD